MFFQVFQFLPQFLDGFVKGRGGTCGSFLLSPHDLSTSLVFFSLMVSGFPKDFAFKVPTEMKMVSDNGRWTMVDGRPNGPNGGRLFSLCPKPKSLNVQMGQWPNG